MTTARRSASACVRMVAVHPGMTTDVRATPPFRERLDEVMRDRHREGRLQPVRMLAGEHQPHLLALEPAAVLQLRRVALDLRRQRLGVAADHQRGGEGPGLARMIGDAADRDAGLLLHLAPHRLLDRLARLQESGERGIHAGREARLPAEQAALAVDRQHDDDRIDARKRLDLAGGADAADAAALQRRAARRSARKSGWRRASGDRSAPAPAPRGRRAIERALDRERAEVDRLDAVGQRGPAGDLAGEARPVRRRRRAGSGCRASRPSAPRLVGVETRAELLAVDPHAARGPRRRDRPPHSRSASAAGEVGLVARLAPALDRVAGEAVQMARFAEDAVVEEGGHAGSGWVARQESVARSLQARRELRRKRLRRARRRKPSPGRRPRPASAMPASSRRRAITCTWSCATTLPSAATLSLSQATVARSAALACDDLLHQRRRGPPRRGRRSRASPARRGTRSSHG